MDGDYSIPWDPSDPDGGADANSIDDSIRDLKTSIEERMDDLLGGEGRWAADPMLEPGDLLVKRRRPWHAGHIVTSAGTVTKAVGNIAVTGSGGALTMFCDLDVPEGATITKVEAIIRYTDTDHSAQTVWAGRTQAAGVFTHNLVLSGTSGDARTMTWTGTVVAAAGEYYYISLILANNELDIGVALGVYEFYYEYTTPNLLVR